MDEIKEEFEKLEITCLAGIVLGQCEYIHLSKNGFGCNYKYHCGFQRPDSNSRQLEIEKLNQDCKNLVEINDNQSKVVESRDAEIKELREALTHIIYIIGNSPFNCVDVQCNDIATKALEGGGG